MNQTDIEEILRAVAYATGAGVGEVMEKIGLNRNQFNGRRRSMNEGTKAAFAREIIAAYPEVFPDGQVTEGGKEKPGADIYERHIALLERSLSKAEAQAEAATNYANHPFFTGK